MCLKNNISVLHKRYINVKSNTVVVKLSHLLASSFRTFRTCLGEQSEYYVVQREYLVSCSCRILTQSGHRAADTGRCILCGSCYFQRLPVEKRHFIVKCLCKDNIL